MNRRPRSSGSIGQIIKRLRKEARLKQAALAEAAGFSQPTLSRIERGYHLPDEDQRENIANALGCKVAELTKAA